MKEYNERFDNHVLRTILDTDSTKVFEFRNVDGCGYNYQRWIIHLGTLIVTGDNYSAIYKWNDSKITLKFLAECDLGYFSSKCVADKDGSSQSVFCSDHTENYLKEIASERIFNEHNEIEIDDDEWYAMDISKKFELISHIILTELDIDEYELENLFCFDNESDVYSFLTDQVNEFMFGIDAWEYAKGVQILSMTPKMHLTALRVAYEKYPNTF